MSFLINRSINWIGEALDRALGKGAGGTENPGIVPDLIMPGLDVFGWSRIAEIRSFSTAGAAAADLVDPPLVDGWIASGAEVVVPPNVQRLLYVCGIQHNDATNRVVWIDRADFRGNPLGITYVPMPMDTGRTAVPANCMVGLAQPIILNPGDSLRGRGVGVAGAAFLTMRVSWIDLRLGEYVPYLA